MKKINLKWPIIISYIITSLSALLIPGILDGYMIHYGFPFTFLDIRNELTLNPNEILFSRIGIDLSTFLVDIVIYAVLIWFIIWAYRKISKKENKETSAK